MIDAKVANVLADAVRLRFSELGLVEPSFYVFQPAAGAEVISVGPVAPKP